jgi:hypothetical protein
VVDPKFLESLVPGFCLTHGEAAAVRPEYRDGWNACRDVILRRIAERRREHRSRPIAKEIPAC